MLTFDEIIFYVICYLLELGVKIIQDFHYFRNSLVHRGKVDALWH